MTFKNGFEKDNLIKLADISVILISFLVLLYVKESFSKLLSLLIMYTGTRNLIKEFVYPLR